MAEVGERRSGYERPGLGSPARGLGDEGMLMVEAA